MRWAGRTVAKLCRLKRRLASSTRRLISAVRSAFSHTVGGLLMHLIGCLINEICTAHTFRHEAHGLRLGFRNCQSERTTHCNDICHNLCKAVPRSGNDARDAFIQHSPDRLRLHHSFLGFISPCLRPPSPFTSFSSFTHLGAHHILHRISIYLRWTAPPVWQ